MGLPRWGWEGQGMLKEPRGALMEGAGTGGRKQMRALGCAMCSWRELVSRPPPSFPSIPLPLNLPLPFQPFTSLLSPPSSPIAPRGL